MKISDLDKNLKVSDGNIPQSAVWLDAKSDVFKLYGVFYDEENHHFARMPKSVAANVSKGVEVFSCNTSGGRIRFKTNSRFIGIKAVMENSQLMPHITLAAQSGFDLFVRDNLGIDRYCSTFLPPFGMTKGYSSVYYVKQKYYDSNLSYKDEALEYTINFPLYDEVKELYIALDKDAVLLEADGYKDLKPMVFYGSSITHGGCASRPGNSYPVIISRELNIDFINLGFSGNAKGEDAIMDYIASLDMSVFVYDYDHNAPTTEHLAATHYKGYKKVRDAHPDMPIIMMTRPKYHIVEFEKERNAVVRETFGRAISEGDKKVYFIDGRELLDPEMIEGLFVMRDLVEEKGGNF